MVKSFVENKTDISVFAESCDVFLSFDVLVLKFQFLIRTSLKMIIISIKLLNIGQNPSDGFEFCSSGCVKNPFNILFSRTTNYTLREQNRGPNDKQVGTWGKEGGWDLSLGVDNWANEIYRSEIGAKKAKFTKLTKSQRDIHATYRF